MSFTIPVWAIYTVCGVGAALGLLAVGAFIGVVAYCAWEAREIGRIFGW